MPSSERGSLLCPFPVLFYWALWKTGGSCIVSKCPSLVTLLGCSSRTFCLCHLLSSPRITHPPCYALWPSLEEALHSPGLGSRKGPAWLHTADSRLLLFILGTEGPPLPRGQAACYTSPSLVPRDSPVLGSGPLPHSHWGLQYLSASPHCPSPGAFTSTPESLLAEETPLLTDSCSLAAPRPSSVLACSPPAHPFRR